MTPALQRSLPGLRYAPVNRDWEMADFRASSAELVAARRFVVARRFLSAERKQPTLFALGRYVYRAWVTNLALTPISIWHFYNTRAAIEPHIGELLEDMRARNCHRLVGRRWSGSRFLAYNLVAAFQRLGVPESWQRLTLSKLRDKLVLLPGELARPQNRPVLRLRESSILQALAADILHRINQLRPLIL